MKENDKQFLEAVEESKRRLAAGGIPEDVFDWRGDFHDGFAAVVLNDKDNYINSDGELLSTTWFDWGGDFKDGFARVELNDKYNFIGRNGNYLSDTWFDYCCGFYEGFAAVVLNEKWNFIDHNGNILSDKWFNYCGNFRDGFAIVELNGGRYRLRKDGVLCNRNTMEPIKPDHSVSPDTDYKKRYEQALERARNIRFGNPQSDTANVVCEEIFPELKESDENKIIDALKVAVHAYCSTDHNYVTTIPKGQLIAWIEKQGKVKHTCRNCQTFQDLHQNCTYSPIYQYKDLTEAHKHLDDETHCEFWIENQGEQKPTDKTEPKFKVGDWLQYRNAKPFFVEEITKQGYVNGDSCLPFNWENEINLWTIQDAKDGDVLCCENGWTCIFKKLNSDISFSSHCFMDKTGWFCEIGGVSHTLEKSFVKAYSGNTYPATKEQRDILFSKMKEAGYEWDSKEKKLKKIEQKSTWSEEDEENFNKLSKIICDSQASAKIANKLSDWLESLKERVK